MKNITEKWVEQARYDIETANAMLSSGRYLYVFFCCQQALEKPLKALIVHKTEEFPPRLHNLPRLAEFAEINPDENILRFLAQLSAFYIQTRYPEGMDSTELNFSDKYSKEILDRTSEVMDWLLSMLE